jgi:phosphoserine aminotransferase
MSTFFFSTIHKNQVLFPIFFANLHIKILNHMKKHNFGAGPSILPQVVIDQAALALKNFNNMDLSILEISHRNKNFIAVLEKAQNLALELAGLKDKGYYALFLQGGASTQFLMAPYNFLPIGGTAGYIDTGTWSSAAIKEAKKLGNVNVLASSKENAYKNIPKNVAIPDGLSYVHVTSNNTIYGTQFKEFPKVNCPLLVDTSSDMFSHVVDYSQFDLIYAGAQKNIGASGTTLVLVKQDALGKSGRDIPSMMDYQLQIAKDSLYNTPSVFSIYVSMLNLEWLQNDMGGLKGIEKVNFAKADLLYNELDTNKNFIPYVDKEDRSIMNVTFNLSDESMKERFDKLCSEAGIWALSGHRSVGGYRASLYNALPLESVKVLVDVMKAL